jgi:hypothetical protein
MSKESFFLNCHQIQSGAVYVNVGRAGGTVIIDREEGNAPWDKHIRITVFNEAGSELSSHIVNLSAEH